MLLREAQAHNDVDEVGAGGAGEEVGVPQHGDEEVAVRQAVARVRRFFGRVTPCGVAV